MTAEILQRAIKADLEDLFEGHLFQDSNNEYVPLNVFEQQLPQRNSDEAPDPVPYIIVRIETGKTVIGNAQEVFVTMIFGACDLSEDNQGHHIILGMIQKVQERYQKNPMLAHQFMFMNDEDHSFDWALQDEESYPFFFGAASMTFATAAIQKEDRFA